VQRQLDTAAHHHHPLQVLGRVTLAEKGQRPVVDGLESRHHEQHPARHQTGQEIGVIEEVLHFDGRIERQVGVPGVGGLQHPKRVGGPVEEVGITKGDVTGARLDLTVDVCQDGVRPHHPS
jgi:hypothetical protein